MKWKCSIFLFLFTLGLSSYSMHRPAVILIPLGHTPSLEEVNAVFLRAVCSADNVDLVKKVLEWNPDIDICNKESKQTALMQAIKTGNQQVVALLLEKGANIHLRDIVNATALMHAAHCGHLAMVRLLLEKGANIDEQDISGNTALLLALRQQRKEVAIELIKWGADIHKVDTYDQSALTYAAVWGDEEIVSLLLQKKVHINSADCTQRTPLMVASAYGHATIVRKLIEAGADPNAVTSRGLSSAACAVIGGDTEVFKELVESGANGDIFAVAVIKGDIEIVKALIKIALPGPKSNALKQAQTKGRWDIVKVFLEAGIQDQNAQALLNSIEEFGSQKDLRYDRCSSCKISRKETILRLCGGCKIARYCSPECQKADWKVHKTLCTAIKNVKIT